MFQQVYQEIHEFAKKVVSNQKFWNKVTQWRIGQFICLGFFNKEFRNFRLDRQLTRHKI